MPGKLGNKRSSQGVCFQANLQLARSLVCEGATDLCCHGYWEEKLGDTA